MISFSEIEKGIVIIFDGQPYTIIKTEHMFKGRGSSVVQTKLKNLKTGNVVSKTFHASDNFEEAKISRINAKFIYESKGKYVFSEEKNPSKRFELNEDIIGDQSRFLKPNMIIEVMIFNEEALNVSLPIKMKFEVVDAPPGIQGDRAQAGNKVVKIETGTPIDVPLFVKQGDIIEVNTETGEYCRRITE